MLQLRVQQRGTGRSPREAYYLRVLGFTYPEAELRQQWDSTSDGRLGKQRDFPGYATVMAGMKKFTDLPVPVLVIFGIPHGQGNWVDNSTDPKVCEAAKAYSAALTALTESQAKAFENAVPTARVVRLRGAHHYVFLSNEADAPREMRPFLSAVADEWPRFTIRMRRRHAARVPRNGVPIGRVVGNWPNCYAWQTDVSLSNQQSCALRFQPVRRCS